MGACLPPAIAAACTCLMLQGAVFFYWTRDAVDTAAGAPVQLQMRSDQLAAALEAKGISRDKPVVVGGKTRAAYLTAHC